MAASIKIETTITTVDLRGKTKSQTFTKNFTGLTAIDERDFAVTADQTRVLWDPVNDADENMSDFDVLIAISDGILDLELVTDVGADVGDEATMVRLLSDTPFILGSDVGKANVTGIDVLGTGTLDVIDKIRVDEPESSVKALKIIMAT